MANNGICWEVWESERVAYEGGYLGEDVCCQSRLVPQVPWGKLSGSRGAAEEMGQCEGNFDAVVQKKWGCF